MRQRRIKDLDIRLENLQEWNISKPEELKGRWRNFFKDIDNKELYLEVGCGKGRFITELAKKNPNKLFIAIEVQPSACVLSMEKARDSELENIIFINKELKSIEDIFEENELSGIYLNFSDPWHKKRHAKRRLTHRRFLNQYMNVIANNGFIKVKTDNENLFEFTLEEIEGLDLNIDEISRDLHSSEYMKDNIMTEYEEKFSTRGKNINYVKITW